MSLNWSNNNNNNNNNNNSLLSSLVVLNYRTRIWDIIRI